MLITIDWLNEKSACSAGKQWFTEHFPEGGEYQDVLNALAAENSSGFGQWLLEAAGPSDTVLEVDWINDEASLFFAGLIIVKGALKVAKYLFAGRSINAGECISAGWGISAGDGYGIYAGLRARISQKKEDTTIRAKEKPENIICGEWAEG